MNEQLLIQCGPLGKSGRRLVIASYAGSEHRDRFDTDSDYHRRKFRERLIDKFGFADDAHQWIEQRIIVAADAEDARGDGDSEFASKPVLVTMSDVEARSVNWLWRHRIAACRISLLVGMPGIGKSFLTCDMASRISTGTPWPDGSPCTKGSVILVSAEDDPSDTIRPRLDAHRADPARVHLLSTVKRTDDDGRESEMLFSLSDIDALENALKLVDDCRLIVVDPIGSFLGGRTDAHRDNEVRSVLAPVAKLAEKYGPAVLVVAHRRKSAGTVADDMALGSRAFTGIARSVWHLSLDAEAKQRRLLLPGKCNLAAVQNGLAFTIAGDPGTIHWESEPVGMTADEALAQETSNDGAGSALNEAIRWLGDYLQDGAKQSKQVQDAARADGIAKRTLDRARSKLEVVTGPDGQRGPWMWRLPEGNSSQSSPTISQFAKDKTLAHSEEFGALCEKDSESVPF